MAKRKVSLHQLAFAKRQTLSCVRFEDLPNELMIGIFSHLNMKELIKCGKVSKRFQAITVDEQGRRKEDLLKIIQILQCFKCKKVPGSNGDENKRYLCKNSAHCLCEKHKESCPCGSLVEENPSQSIAIQLQNLPWICQNYKWGCHEVKMDVKNLKAHHGKCIFRRVFCPNSECKNLEVDYGFTICWGKKVCFKDIFDHLNNDHKDTWYEIVGESNKWNKWTDFIKGDFLDGTSWSPCKMTTTNGDVFSLVARVHKEVVHLWMLFFGTSEEARKFLCRISIKNKFGIEFIYSGPVHTLDKTEKAIVNSGFLLLVGPNAAKNLAKEENGLEIEVTIRNLKNETISKESQVFYKAESEETDSDNE